MKNKYDINEININSALIESIYKYCAIINQKIKDLKFIYNGKFYYLIISKR